MLQHYCVYFIPSDLIGIEVIPQFHSSFPSLFLNMCNGAAKRYGEQFLLNSSHYPLIKNISQINDNHGHDDLQYRSNFIATQLGDNPKTVDSDYLMQNLIERYARAWSSKERKQIRANLDSMVTLNENVLETKPETEGDVLELYHRVMSYPEKPKHVSKQ